MPATRDYDAVSLATTRTWVEELRQGQFHSPGEQLLLAHISKLDAAMRQVQHDLDSLVVSSSTEAVNQPPSRALSSTNPEDYSSLADGADVKSPSKQTVAQGRLRRGRRNWGFRFAQATAQVHAAAAKKDQKDPEQSLDRALHASVEPSFLDGVAQAAKRASDADQDDSKVSDPQARQEQGAGAASFDSIEKITLPANETTYPTENTTVSPERSPLTTRQPLTTTGRMDVMQSAASVTETIEDKRQRFGTENAKPIFSTPDHDEAPVDSLNNRPSLVLQPEMAFVPAEAKFMPALSSSPDHIVRRVQAGKATDSVQLAHRLPKTQGDSANNDRTTLPPKGLQSRTRTEPGDSKCTAVLDEPLDFRKEREERRQSFIDRKKIKSNGRLDAALYFHGVLFLGRDPRGADNRLTNEAPAKLRYNLNDDAKPSFLPNAFDLQLQIRMRDVQKKIGYWFNDKELLREALSFFVMKDAERIAGFWSNKRLALLGDKVLSLPIYETWYFTGDRTGKEVVLVGCTILKD